jgi:cellulose biosynthesis protein BcsQ
MPGEGKTTVVANLAAGFAENSGDVLVLSADPRRPAIESMLLKRQGAAAKLASSSRPDAVLTTVPGVKLVRACDPDTNPASIVTYERQVALRGRANSQVVIIDTPPALVANDATELMHAADSTLLVARAGVTTVAAAQRVAELLSRHGVAAVGVVLIGVASPAMASSGYYRKEQRQAQRSTPRRTGEHSKPKGRKRAAEPVGRRIVDLTDLDEIPPAAPAPRPAPRLFGREGDPSREPPTADRDGPHGNEGASTTRYGDGNGHGAWAPSSPRTEPAEQAGSWSSSE